MIPNHPIGKDLLSAANLSLSDIQEVLARATALWKDDGNSAVTANSRKVIANLFFQRSTRTKLGFEVAAMKLGHRAIDAYDPSRNRAGSANGDSFADHIRTIAQFSDLLVFRHSDEHLCREVARLSPVPVINGGNGYDEHPTQGLVDLFCMTAMRGDVRNISLAISGDTRARYAYSLLLLLKKMPPKRLTICIDVESEIVENTKIAIDFLEQHGTQVSVVHNVEDCLDHDVLIHQSQNLTSKVKSSIEESDLPSYVEKDAFVLTADKVLKAKSDTIILNPLPRQGELDPSCDTLPNARYFEQVKLSTFIRMAVLERMLAGVPWTGQSLQ